MAILRKIIILSLPLVLAGCREEFIPLIDTKPVLCLNSLITAGEPIEVSVTHTWVYTDVKGEEDHTVNDASIAVYANGRLVGDEYLPQEGDHIRIEAFSNTYGDAWAEVVVPIATPILEVNYQPKVTDSWFEDRQQWGLSLDIRFNISTTLTISNHPATPQFYLLNIDKYQPTYETRWETSPSSVHFFEGNKNYQDPFFTEYISSFEEMMDGGYLYDDICFSNSQFEGNSQDIHVDFTNAYLQISQWDRNPDLLECGYTFKLNSISESYFKWIIYRWQSEESILGDIIDVGLSEPIWGYSNVSTGAGVVAAQSSASINLNLHDFLYNYISKECK